MAIIQVVIFFLAYVFFAAPLLAQENPTDLTNVNGTIFFAASTPDKGTELWKSNGTTAGTLLVKDIASMAASSSPANLKMIGSTLYFTANSKELWKSNGTAEGTVLIKSFTSSVASPVSQLTDVNGILYFVLDKGGNSYELWKSDGTGSGTVLLKSVVSTAQARGIAGLTNLNGVVYFSGYEAASGWELWKSNGTSAGTLLVKDIYPGTTSSWPSNLYAWNGNLYFAANDGSEHKTELWKSDGTAAGTILLKDIAPEEYGQWGSKFGVSSSPSTFVAFKGALYFVAQSYYDRYSVGDERELWKTDGTTAGTVFVKSIGLSAQLEMLVINETLFFVAQTLQIDAFESVIRAQQLWKSDGTGAGTVVIKEFYKEPHYGVFPSFELTNLNGTLLFALPGSEVNDGELWKSDGTSQGTIQVKEIYPDGDGDHPKSSALKELTAANNTLLFSAYDGTGANRQLWKSDGTEAGTVKLTTQSSYLPSPWTSRDISGIVIAPGSASYSNGKFIVHSAGFDFYKAPDSFHYVSQPFNGNATIVAKVESIGNTHPNALAGVMIRQDHPANTSFVALAVTASGNINFMWRQYDGIPGYKSVPGAAPRWLKLSRNGNVYTAYSSADGSSWTSIGETTIIMTSNTYVGMALTSQSSHYNWATFSNVSLSTTPSSTACAGAGSISREFWANVTGGNIDYIPFNTTPTSSTQITSFETPTNIADTYGQRIRGYLCVPVSDYYSFSIASDDESMLYLSADEDPRNKRVIGSVSGWTKPREWNKYASQVLTSQHYLQAGKKYYIEAQHIERAGGDNLAVAWKRSGTEFSVIPGSALLPYVAPVCTASGSILREYWANAAGKTVAEIPLSRTPTSSVQIRSFEAPSNIGDNYGQRIRGYLCAPATGNYTFYIASDDNSELWLGLTDNATSKRKIASVTGWARNGDWTKYASQRSVTINLEKGRRYYIEALHKEASGGDNLAVAWTLPGSSSITVIPGSVLSPVVPSTARLAIEVEAGQSESLVVYPNPFEDKLTITTQGQQGKILLTLTDVVGKTYLRKEYELSGQADVELDLASLQLKAGIHLLKMQTEDGQTQVVKVVKR